MKNVASIAFALLGLAALAPAQIRLEGLLGRHFRVAATIGDECRPHTRPVAHCPPPVCEPRREPRHCEPRPCGHWETVCEQVFVPGYYREEHVPARYGWIRGHCGRSEWGVIEPEHCERVWVPGYYKTEHRRVWVEGR